jgi:hypothetical protein
MNLDLHTVYNVKKIKKTLWDAWSTLVFHSFGTWEWGCAAVVMLTNTFKHRSRSLTRISLSYSEITMAYTMFSDILGLSLSVVLHLSSWIKSILCYLNNAVCCVRYFCGWGYHPVTIYYHILNLDLVSESIRSHPYLISKTSFLILLTTYANATFVAIIEERGADLVVFTNMNDSFISSRTLQTCAFILQKIQNHSPRDVK